MICRDKQMNRIRLFIEYGIIGAIFFISITKSKFFHICETRYHHYRRESEREIRSNVRQNEVSNFSRFLGPIEL